MEFVRWGVIGPGRIAMQFADAIKNVKNAKLCGVASRTREKSEAFAEKYNVPKIFNSYEEMARSDEIDAVYVATIHPVHLFCAEMFLKNKKHVLCEKPLCVNEGEVSSLISCARENGVFLMEALWTRFLPAVREAVRTAKSGAIGELLGADIDFSFRVSDKTKARTYKNELAGGALLDVGVYTLNLSAMLFGYDAEISASSLNENGVDVYTSMCLKYKNAIANLSCAICAQKPCDAYIYGTDGYIHLPKFYTAREFSVIKGDERTTYESPYLGNGFEEEIIEATDCILSGKTESRIMSLRDSYNIIRQMDNVRKIIGVKYSQDE